LTHLRRLERALAARYRLGPRQAWALRTFALHSGLGAGVTSPGWQAVVEALEKRGLYPVPPKIRAAYLAARRQDASGPRGMRASGP